MMKTQNEKTLEYLIKHRSATSIELRRATESSYPVIRRCINLIKDRIVRHEGEFVKKNNDDPNDYLSIIKIFNGMLERPNLKDTRRTFLSAVCEDLVVGIS